MHAGIITLELLASQAEHPAVKALRGFLVSSPPVKVPKDLIPPKPVVLALIAVGAAFPKCVFTVDFRILSSSNIRVVVCNQSAERIA